MDISCDGLQLNFTAKVQANPIGKIIVVLLFFAAIYFFGTLIYHVGVLDMKAMLMPIAAFVIIVGYFMGRYILWNFYGREIISITSKVLTYQFDYGWFKTEKKDIAFVRLATDYPDRDAEEGTFEFVLDNGMEDEHSEEWGFVNHSSIHHTTTVLLPKTVLYTLDIELKKIFQAANKADCFLPHSRL